MAEPTVLGDATIGYLGSCAYPCGEERTLVPTGCTGGVWFCRSLLRFLRQYNNAPIARSKTATPPTAPPTMAPMFVFAPGTGDEVGGGMAVAVCVGRTRVGVRAVNEACSP